MRERPLKTTISGLAVVLCAIALPVLSGCKSEDNVVAIETSPLCPNCYAETRIQPITGLKYTTAICPVCKKVSNLDDTTRAAVEAYTGTGVGSAVRVCDTCEALIGECAACRQAPGM